MFDTELDARRDAGARARVVRAAATRTVRRRGAGQTAADEGLVELGGRDRVHTQQMPHRVARLSARFLFQQLEELDLPIVGRQIQQPAEPHVVVRAAVPVVAPLGHALQGLGDLGARGFGGVPLTQNVAQTLVASQRGHARHKVLGYWRTVGPQHLGEDAVGVRQTQHRKGQITEALLVQQKGVHEKETEGLIVPNRQQPGELLIVVVVQTRDAPHDDGGASVFSPPVGLYLLCRLSPRQPSRSASRLLGEQLTAVTVKVLLADYAGGAPKGVI